MQLSYEMFYGIREYGLPNPTAIFKLRHDTLCTSFKGHGFEVCDNCRSVKEEAHVRRGYDIFKFHVDNAGSFTRREIRLVSIYFKHAQLYMFNAGLDPSYIIYHIMNVFKHANRDSRLTVVFT